MEVEVVANRERQAPLAGGQDGEEDLKERRFTQEVEVVEEVVVGGEEEPAEERLPVGLLAGPANPKPQHEKMPEVTDPASRTKLQVSKKKKKKLSSIPLFYSAFRTWKKIPTLRCESVQYF